MILFEELKTKEDVAEFLGVTIWDINRVIRQNGKEQMYTQFTIPKKNGSQRIINAPSKPLKFLQRQLADRLTELYIEKNGNYDSAHGFVRRRNIISNARKHLRRTIYNIDLKNFFPSIGYYRVYRLLIYFKIGQEAAKTLALLATFNNELPQGSPCSPVLSNLICYMLDKKLSIFANKRGFIYSRYADDLTFSVPESRANTLGTDAPLYFENGTIQVNSTVIKIIEDNGFRINNEKLRISGRGMRKEVTGIVVNEKLNISRDYYRKIRSRIHNLSVAVSRDLIDDKKKADEVESIVGCISFIRQVRGESDILSLKLADNLNNALGEERVVIDSKSRQIDYISRRTFLINPSYDDAGINNFNLINGTGFFLKVSNKKYFITCNHTFDNTDDIGPVKIGKNHLDHKTTFKSAFIMDPFTDIAYLENGDKINDYFFEAPNKVNDYKYKLNDNVIYAGYPDYNYCDNSSENRLTVSKVRVASNSPIHIEGVEMITIYPDFRKGASGGPVLNENLEIIGMVLRGPSVDTLKEGLDIPSAFIPISEILKFIKKKEDSVGLPSKKLD